MGAGLRAAAGGISNTAGISNAAIKGGQPRIVKGPPAGSGGLFTYGNAKNHGQRVFGGMGAGPGAKVGGVNQDFAVLDDQPKGKKGPPAGNYGKITNENAN